MTAEEMERRYLVPTYNGDGVRTAPGLLIERGDGAHLIASDGRRFIDWAAGIAVNALGHSDPAWVAVVASQAAKIAHTSNLFHTAEPLQLAQAMVQRSANFTKVFFCNSGTEANEAALKFARKHALVRAWREAGLATDAASVPATTFACKSAKPTACITRGGMCGCWPQSAHNEVAVRLRDEVIAFKNSFHGRSMGALSMTHKPAIRQPFGPFPGDVRFGRFNVLAGRWMHRRPLRPRPAAAPTACRPQPLRRRGAAHFETDCGSDSGACAGRGGHLCRDPRLHARHPTTMR